MHDTTRKRWVPGARSILALLAALGALAYAWSGYAAVGRPGLPLDDSWIHLQFARNLAAGNGLAFEPGVLVPASTAPLWTVLLSLLAPLPGSAVLWSQLLGSALAALGASAFYGLARDTGLSSGVALFAGLAMVITGPLTWAAVSGLEIPLFILLTLFGLRLHLRDRGREGGLALSLPVFALAVLARPEGALLLGLALVDRGLAVEWRWRRWLAGAAGGLALAGLILLPAAWFNLALSGSVVPTTFAAKSGGLKSLWPNLRYLHTAFGIFFRAQPYLTLLAAGGVVTLARRVGGDRDRGLLPAAWCAALPVAYSCLASPGAPLVGNFGRYLYPLLPLVILLGCLALDGLSPLGGGSGRWRRIAAVAIAALALLPTASHWLTTAGLFARSVRNLEDGDLAAARWLGDRLPPGAKLAVNDIGALKYVLPEHEIFDLAGIVTPEVHAYTRAAVSAGHSWEEGVRTYLDSVRPDFLVVFPEWFPGMLASEVSFKPQRVFAVPGNIALGGDQVVIYRTPWTHRELTK